MLQRVMMDVVLEQGADVPVFLYRAVPGARAMQNS